MDKKSLLLAMCEDDVPIILTDYEPEAKPSSNTTKAKAKKGKSMFYKILSLTLSLLCLAVSTYLFLLCLGMVRGTSPDIIVKIFYNPSDGITNSAKAFGPTPSCGVSTSNKVDCMPSGKATQQECLAKGCCWVPVDGNVKDTPWCFYKSDTSEGYKFTEAHVTHAGYEALYSRADNSIWPEDVMDIQMDIYEETSSRLHFKIFDQKNHRYEVPIDTPPITPNRPTAKDYLVKFSRDVFGITVTRPDGSVLFDTTGTKLTFADQYIEITTNLPTNYIYGLGEHRDRLLHDVSKGFSMSTWARDQPPPGCVNCNLYGQHPFFIGLEEKTGNAYGVFLLNSNAMEIKGTPASNNQPAQLTYRTIGGILDFYVFTGPSPAAVVQQYLEVVGLPYMPPYWGLGFHLCRWGYNSDDHMKSVIKRMRDYGFPYDTQWNDIDYMNKFYDWTYDKDKYADLPSIVKDLHDNGQHYIMIVDCGIANVTGYDVYDEGLKEGVFIQHADKDEPIIGKVWPGYTAYPDFFKNSTKKWWLKLAQQYHQSVPFDGAWTDMNEPSNFVVGSTEGCTTNKYDNPPFTPSIVGGSLSQKTLCPSARHGSDLHYNLHSLYGHSELMATQMALHQVRPEKRTVVISRSTFPSSGRYAGHWTGDNAATWDDIKYSIPGILNFQFFGIPFVGADVCGFMGETTGELCVRWMQLGAFYPFMRNHNTEGTSDQDPAADMFSDVEKKAMLSALRLRYTLLPHLYTLLASAHVNGTTVARPLWFEYPLDQSLYGNDKQLMWGDSIMVAPVLDKGATSVTAYFPADTWVDYATGDIITSSGQTMTVNAALDKIPVYVRAGGIIPLQSPDVTTTKSRLLPFALYAVLDKTGQACGSLYWDDGETLDAAEKGYYNLLYFTIKDNKLTSSYDKMGYSTNMKLDTVFLNNVNQTISAATVNGATAVVTKTNSNSYTLTFSMVDMSSPLTITWT